jgi:DNA-binding transcriptional LysR family regulator
VADDLWTLKLAILRGTGVFHAVFPSRRGLVPAVRRFLDFLGEAIAREGLAQVPAG